MKNQNGVTVVLPVLTVLIMIIILGTITYTSKSSFQMNQYYRMCSDIELLDEKIALYYLEHESEKTNLLLDYQYLRNKPQKTWKKLPKKKVM